MVFQFHSLPQEELVITLLSALPLTNIHQQLFSATRATNVHTSAPHVFTLSLTLQHYYFCSSLSCTAAEYTITYTHSAVPHALHNVAMSHAKQFLLPHPHYVLLAVCRCVQHSLAFPVLWSSVLLLPSSECHGHLPLYTCKLHLDAYSVAPSSLSLSSQPQQQPTAIAHLHQSVSCVKTATCDSPNYPADVEPPNLVIWLASFLSLLCLFSCIYDHYFHLPTNMHSTGALLLSQQVYPMC